MIPSCPLVRSVWGAQSRRRLDGGGEKKKSSVQTTAYRCLRCTPWASVVSRPHCFWTIATNLPSGSDRLCWAGRGGIVQPSIVSPVRRWPVDTDKWGDNGLYLGVVLLPRLFIRLAEKGSSVNSTSTERRELLLYICIQYFPQFG